MVLISCRFKFKILKDWHYADGIRQLGEREAKQQQYKQPFNDQF